MRTRFTVVSGASQTRRRWSCTREKSPSCSTTPAIPTPWSPPASCTRPPKLAGARRPNRGRRNLV